MRKQSHHTNLRKYIVRLAAFEPLLPGTYLTAEKFPPIFNKLPRAGLEVSIGGVRLVLPANSETGSH